MDDLLHVEKAFSLQRSALSQTKVFSLFNLGSPQAGLAER
jgi:hypothetical protein